MATNTNGQVGNSPQIRRVPRRFSGFLALAACALMVMCAHLLQPDNLDEVDIAVGLALIGVVLLGCALFVPRRWISYNSAPPGTLSDHARKSIVSIRRLLAFSVVATVLLVLLPALPLLLGQILFTLIMGTGVVTIAATSYGAIRDALISAWQSIALGIRESTRPADLLSDEHEQAVNPRAHWRAAAVGVIILCVLAINGLQETSAEIFGLRWLWYTSQHIQFVLFVVGVTLVVYGFGGGRLSFTKLIDRIFDSKPFQKHRLILYTILLLAATVRVWDLEFGGTHRFIDEIYYANAVTRMWDSGHNKLLIPFNDEVTAFSWLFPYVQYWSVGITGPSLTGLRLVSGAFGTLTVLALYFLAKVLFDRKTALLTALFLATFPPHVHFSRIGINNIADPLFGVLTLAFLARGLKVGRRMDFAVAGACLGMTQYFYEGGRLLYPPLVVGWLMWVIVARFWRRRVWDARFWHNVLVFFVVFAIVAIPFYYTLIAQSRPLTRRLDVMGRSTGSWEKLFSNPEETPINSYLKLIAVPLQSYVQIPETGWFYASGQGGGLVLHLTVPLFLLGAALAFWWIRSPGGGLLAIWLLATAAGNSLLSDGLWAARYVVVFPAMSLTIAVGLRYTLPLILPDEWFVGTKRTKYISSLQQMVIIALSLGVTAYQIGYYFGQHLPRFDEHFYKAPAADGFLVKDGDDVLFRAVQLPPNTHVYVIGRTIMWPIDIATTLRFWGRHDDMRMKQESPESFTSAYLNSLPRGVNYAFFLEPEDGETYGLIRQYFTLDRATFSPYDVPLNRQFALYFASIENNRYRPVRQEGYDAGE